MKARKSQLNRTKIDVSGKSLSTELQLWGLPGRECTCMKPIMPAAAPLRSAQLGRVVESRFGLDRRPGCLAIADGREPVQKMRDPYKGCCPLPAARPADCWGGPVKGLAWPNRTRVSGGHCRGNTSPGTRTTKLSASNCTQKNGFLDGVHFR